MDNSLAYSTATTAAYAIKAKADDQSAPLSSLQYRDIIYATIQSATKEEQNKAIEGVATGTQPLDDPAYARAWLIAQLKSATESGNAAAMKEVRDLLKIGDAASEIEVHSIDYRSQCADCPLARPPALPSFGTDGTSSAATSATDGHQPRSSSIGDAHGELSDDTSDTETETARQDQHEHRG